MLIGTKRQASSLQEENIIGSFATERKGYEILTHRGPYNYWTSLVNDEQSVFMNSSRKLTKVIDAAIDGLDANAAKAIVAKAFDEGTVIRYQARNADNADGTKGDFKKDAEGNFVWKYVVSAQGEKRLSEDEVNALVASAPKEFTIQASMASRV